MVGAGIAGASVAYFLSRAGVSVTVADLGQHTASHVPSALVNPVRGQSGQGDARAVAGMRRTWQLLDELTRHEYAVPHAKTGVWRPVPDEKTRNRFIANLPTDLAAHWQAPQPPLHSHWQSVLVIEEGGWLAGPALCQALLQAAGARLLRGEAKREHEGWTVLNEGQRPIFFAAEHTFFCGGSYGVSRLGETSTHRMGSMLLLESAPAPLPLSFGAYLAPDVRGGVLGGTFETPSPVWQTPRLPLGSLQWLLQKGEALAPLTGMQVCGHWTGSRLSGLQVGRWEGGWRLTGLSSKGFLLGPLLAEQLVREALGPTGEDS